MIISSKITKSIEFCCELHKNQTRKATSIPFASHPISVGFILLSAGYSEEIIIAGILHDILEDTSGTEKDIENIFGKRVVDLIKSVTENTSIKSWEDKKNNYLENLKNAENDMKAISAADALDNCRSMIRVLKSGVNIWNAFTVSPQKIINYYERRLSIIKETLQNKITEEIESSMRELKELANI